MAQFSLDNTEGYGQGDLDELNGGFDRVIAGRPDMAENKSWRDHVCEELTFAYDQTPAQFQAVIKDLLEGRL